MTIDFPDTPRGRYAARRGGRCPVHEHRLRVDSGYALTMDLTPTARFLAVRRHYPWALDLGESREARSGYRPGVTLIWCEACETAALYAYSDPEFPRLFRERP